jgi:hypothetical protein
MLASEVGRLIIDSTYAFSFQPPTTLGTDERLWYLMATRRITGKLSAGAYYSSVIEKQGNYGTGGYQKDWTVATRYDLSPFLYLKFEQHWMNGTLIGFSTSDNTSLQPKTPMTLPLVRDRWLS